MQDRIVIAEYSAEWAVIFNKLDAVYRRFLAGLFDDVQHVGSTAVIGLAAKPVIDIDIIIPERTLFPAIVERLAGLGYEHRGNLGITDRDAFRQRSSWVPVDASGTVWPRHNLYVCPAASISLRNHLTLRDALRADPELARTYGAIKKQLAEQFPYDIDRYIDGKTAFITGILQSAGFGQSELELITAANRVGQ